jgi:hypothetical protein
MATLEEVKLPKSVVYTGFGTVFRVAGTSGSAGQFQAVTVGGITLRR